MYIYIYIHRTVENCSLRHQRIQKIPAHIYIQEQFGSEQGLLGALKVYSVWHLRNTDYMKICVHMYTYMHTGAVGLRTGAAWGGLNIFDVAPMK